MLQCFFCFWGDWRGIDLQDLILKYKIEMIINLLDYQ